MKKVGVTPENVREKALQFDANKDGKIQVEEFVTFVQWLVAHQVAEYFANAGK